MCRLHIIILSIGKFRLLAFSFFSKHGKIILQLRTIHSAHDHKFLRILDLYYKLLSKSTLTESFSRTSIESRFGIFVPSAIVNQGFPINLFTPPGFLVDLTTTGEVVF